ncbi:gag/pol protein [Cucumis melo var. makuwa]|uniref:Gag/pol protein n=1 Tax=Cucumis melo var. makuwa TaxID=1194695 RepID=A0A5D3BGY1_CUCMM|nr:gag/pol protein [Cucumis melo var. makuwa]TYJ97735.1 gag/pol protein [Cucumis melo var. makuwa]
MRHIPYASTIGSLMYAMLCTRTDICYAVGIVSRYQSNPGLSHWTAVKTILKYLRRTRDYMLVYGSVFTLNGGVVVWRSIKQGCIADSTMEAYGVVANSRDPRSHKHGKHIELKYHLIREIVHRGNVIVTQIASTHNVVGPSIKPLIAKVFEGHLESLGLRVMPHLN